MSNEIGEAFVRLDVSPSASGADVRDRASRDPVLDGEVFRLTGASPDLDYLLDGELRLVSALRVDGRGYEFNVPDVHARVVTADVIRLEAPWDRPPLALPCDAMGELLSEAAVALRVEESRPDVASSSRVDADALVEVECLESRAVSVNEPLVRLSLFTASAFASHRPNISRVVIGQ